MKKHIERFNRIKNTLKKEFDFIVPGYVIDDIVIGENYLHICSMINLAKSNNSITEDNATTLKNKIKEIGNIKSNLDIVQL
ncbi:MAG: hypothetical protein IKF38_01135 [Clostridia bacterium]|nr:hypothetical protein [Clostridia bacterium]